MTSNQINNRRALEEERANRAKETENVRSNKARERETERANKAQEKIGRWNIGANYLSAAGKAAQGAASMAKVLNDPSWYNKDKVLVQDVANLSFNVPTGLPIRIGEGLRSSRLPGILTIHYLPTYGECNFEGSALNVAAKQIYSFVRHANSGHANYDPADLMMYLVSLDSAYMFFNFMVRIYGCLNMSSGQNRYVGRALTIACGGNYDDLISKMASFRTYINTFATRLNAFYAPSSLDIFKRHSWLTSHVFVDDKDKINQMYVMRPSHVGIYDETYGAVKFASNSIAMSNFNLQSLQTLGDNILNTLFASEDIGIMSGDILKAYGNSSLYMLSEIPADYQASIVYSAEVLTQITNMDVYGSLLDVNEVSAKVGLCQDSNGVLHYGYYLENSDGTTTLIRDELRFGFTNDFGSTNYTLESLSDFQNIMAQTHINTFGDRLSPDDVMVATRGRSCVTDFQGVNNNIDYTVAVSPAASEIFCVMAITNLNNGGNFYPQYFGSTLRFIRDSGVTLYPAGSGAAFSVDAIADYHCFDWAPALRIIIYHPGYGSNPANVLSLLQTRWITDFNEVASLTKSVLNNMHYVAIQSMLGIPLLGETVRSK